MASVYGVDEFLSTSWDPNTGTPLDVGDRDLTSDTCWGTILLIQKNNPQIKLNTKKHSSPIALKITKYYFV